MKLVHYGYQVSGASTNRSTQNHNTTTSWARYTHEMTGRFVHAGLGNYQT